MAGTELCSMTVNTCHEALEVFGTKYTNRVPVQVTPTSGSFPCVYIPTGVFAMKAIRGRLEDQPMVPGFHWMYPWERVQYILTPQTTMFDTPVKDCPTQDNVTVKIDVIMAFRITDPRRFCEFISPEKLTDVLKSAQEEAVRNLARSVKHTQIYDLVKFDESEIIGDMNAKVSQYGVEITDVMITDVRLPVGMAHTLESETTYQVKQRLQKRAQAFDIMVQQDQQLLQQREQECKNECLAFEEEAKKQRALIAKEIAEINARTAKRLAEIKAENEAVINKIREETNLTASRLDAQKEGLLLEIKAQADADVEKLKSQQLLYVQELESKTQLVYQTSTARITQFDAEAEKTAAAQLKYRREYEREQSRTKILGALAGNASSVISGNTNGNIVAQIEATKMQRAILH